MLKSWGDVFVCWASVASLTRKGCYLRLPFGKNLCQRGILLLVDRDLIPRYSLILQGRIFSEAMHWTRLAVTGRYRAAFDPARTTHRTVSPAASRHPICTAARGARGKGLATWVSECAWTLNVVPLEELNMAICASLEFSSF